MVSISTGRGSSKQDVKTPPDFIAAVEKRFGKISFDLAASHDNTQAERYFAAPGSEDPCAIGYDSFNYDWAFECLRVPPGSLLWLNPEFSNIAPWAQKCAEEAPRLTNGVRIALLVPASVGSNWFKDYVFYKSWTAFLNGRIQFVGHNYAFPKDCSLSIFGGGIVGNDIWSWKSS